MNNEPVAWMNADGKFNKKETWLFPIPLYMYPAKTLTDEEIRKVADEVFKNYKNWHYYQIDFARAILRKAQEK